MDWRQIPSLSALRAFEAAARTQSLSGAAKELNVTHAAIAQHVRALETDFSQTLLTRQGRGVVATQFGQELAAYLSEGFSTIAEGIQDLRAGDQNRVLNLTVTPLFAANWLMPRIGDFWAKHPDIPLNINPNTEIVDLRRDGYDAAIRHGDGNWPGFEVERLTTGEFWAVAHADLVKDRDVTCLADVVDLPWLIEHHMLERRSIIENEGICLDTLNINFLSTNNLVMSAAKSGLGVAVQPKSLVERDVQSGELVRLCEICQKKLSYFLVTLPDRNPPGLRELKSWLSDQANL